MASFPGAPRTWIGAHLLGQVSLTPEREMVMEVPSRGHGRGTKGGEAIGGLERSQETR